MQTQRKLRLSEHEVARFKSKVGTQMARFRKLSLHFDIGCTVVQ